MKKKKKTYYLYHVPGIKVGMTTSIYRRVIKDQGYKPGEFIVVDSSTNKSLIEVKEVLLQKHYGYPVDKDTYDQSINNAKTINMEADFNVTNQTVTFPVPLNKLKGLLMENIGKTIKTPDGDVKITLRNVLNIVDNSKPSMYNINKCFIYNKKLSQLENTEHNSAQHSEPNVCTDNLLPFPLLQETIDETNVYDLIRKWAYDKGILNSGDSKTQYVKLIEEGGELARAILKKDKPEIIDAIGDMIVVLTNLAALEGLKVEDCVVSAYDVIKNRTGKMQNGSFVKETL